MPRLPDCDDTYFATVRGWCGDCRADAPARVFFRDGSVWQRGLCPCGRQAEAMIARDEAWYLREAVVAFDDVAPLPGAQRVRAGCPHDCGPCAWHASPSDTVTPDAVLTTFSGGTADFADGDAEALQRFVARWLEDGEAVNLAEWSAPGWAVDAMARCVAEVAGGGLRWEDFTVDPPAHPLCRLAAVCRRPTGRVARFRVHAPMTADTFDASRALFCPAVESAGPGVRRPGCFSRLFDPVAPQAVPGGPAP